MLKWKTCASRWLDWIPSHKSSLWLRSELVLIVCRQVPQSEKRTSAGPPTNCAVDTNEPLHIGSLIIASERKKVSSRGTTAIVPRVGHSSIICKSWQNICNVCDEKTRFLKCNFSYRFPIFFSHCRRTEGVFSNRCQILLYIELKGGWVFITETINTPYTYATYIRWNDIILGYVQSPINWWNMIN